MTRSLFLDHDGTPLVIHGPDVRNPAKTTDTPRFMTIDYGAPGGPDLKRIIYAFAVARANHANQEQRA